jgi:hypothetical protein
VQPEIEQRLLQDLTRRRELPPQVKRHLISVHGVAADMIGRFFREELTRLEDFEREQMFAPLFTPTLEDRAAYAELLRNQTVSEAEVESAIQRFVHQGLHCAIDVPGEGDFSLPLEDVLIARFLRLLRLSAAPPAEVTERLVRAIPADDCGPALAQLRDPAWRTPAKYAWLAAYLDVVQARQGFSLLKFDFLTDLVRDCTEVNTAHVLALTEHVLGEKRTNFSVGGSAKPFFSRHIEEWHGHSHDHRQFDADEVEQKQRALAMLADLVADLQALKLVQGT